MSGTAAIEEIDRIVEAGGDADDILRGVVSALVDPGGCSWAGILFVESGELVLGPEAGIAEPESRVQVPGVFEGTRVAELAVDGLRRHRVPRSGRLRDLALLPRRLGHRRRALGAPD